MSSTRKMKEREELEIIVMSDIEEKKILFTYSVRNPRYTHQKYPEGTLYNLMIEVAEERKEDIYSILSHASLNDDPPEQVYAQLLKINELTTKEGYERGFTLIPGVRDGLH